MNGAVIETQGLSKTFGTVHAVENISWSIRSGCIFGLAGPNGAGKTTTIKMLLGMTRPTAGTGSVLGHDIVRESVAIRMRAAFIPEDKLLYDDMSVRSFLYFYGSFFPNWDQRVAARFLDAWKVPLERTVKQLSKGMRAKLVLAAALCRKPHVLFMDEPTIDLDPASVEEILSLIAGWVSDGDRTAVFATHRLEEVERICDRVTVLQDGREVLDGGVDDIKEEWKSLRAYGEIPADEVRGWPGVHSVSPAGNVATVVVWSQAAEIAGKLQAAGATGVEADGMNLREIYLTLTNYKRGRLDGAVESLV
jgi:ABC-2 type transport system ATP-binding protein